MVDEEFGDLLVGKIRTRKVETESLGGQPTAVGKLNICVEAGPVLGHSGAV
jgi:hypothetical protein